MSERKYYCFCESNCKFETMSKEQILTAIAQAAETGMVIDEDAGFITKVKEMNAGGFVTFWVGTQAQYNALGRIEKNRMYIITDSNKEELLDAKLAEIKRIAEEGPQMQLLWEADASVLNSATGYAQQKIDADLSVYTMIVMQFRARTQTTANGTEWLLVENVCTIGSGSECVATFAGANNLERRYKVERDGVTIGVARTYDRSGVYSVDNTQMLPYRIYGLKG